MYVLLYVNIVHLLKKCLNQILEKPGIEPTNPDLKGQ